MIFALSISDALVWLLGERDVNKIVADRIKYLTNVMVTSPLVKCFDVSCQSERHCYFWHIAFSDSTKIEYVEGM